MVCQQHVNTSSSPTCLLQQQQTSRAVFAVGHIVHSYTMKALSGHIFGDPLRSNSLAECSMTLLILPVDSHDKVTDKYTWGCMLYLQVFLADQVAA